MHTLFMNKKSLFYASLLYKGRACIAYLLRALNQQANLLISHNRLNILAKTTMVSRALNNGDPTRLSRFVRDREGTKVIIFAPFAHDGVFTTHFVDRHGKVEHTELTLAPGWKRWSSMSDLGADLSFWTRMSPAMKELARHRYKDLRPRRRHSSSPRSSRS